MDGQAQEGGGGGAKAAGSRTLPPRIGRYQILGRLGRGANGEVFIGHDPMLDRELAVKVLHADLPEELRSSLLQRFWIEMRVRGRLSHPHVVEVYDAGMDGDRPFLVMELCSGPTLQRVLTARQTLAPDEVIWVFSQVAEALDYVHARGVVHRDIKPDNLIFDHGLLKLTDFGAAWFALSQFEEQEMMGTPAFMAPEQVTAQGVDHHTDLYAAGVLLYEMLAGRPPFIGDAMAVMHQIALEAPPRFSDVAPGFPPAVDTFFSRALARDPSLRFGSGGEMLEVLRSIFPGCEPRAIEDLERYLNAERVVRLVTAHYAQPPVDRLEQGRASGSVAPIDGAPVASPIAALTGAPAMPPLTGVPAMPPLTGAPAMPPLTGVPAMSPLAGAPAMPPIAALAPTPAALADGPSEVPGRTLLISPVELETFARSVIRDLPTTVVVPEQLDAEPAASEAAQHDDAAEGDSPGPSGPGAPIVARPGDDTVLEPPGAAARFTRSLKALHRTGAPQALRRSLEAVWASMPHARVSPAALAALSRLPPRVANWVLAFAIGAGLGLYGQGGDASDGAPSLAMVSSGVQGSSAGTAATAPARSRGSHKDATPRVMLLDDVSESTPAVVGSLPAGGEPAAEALTSGAAVDVPDGSGLPARAGDQDEASSDTVAQLPRSLQDDPPVSSGEERSSSLQGNGGAGSSAGSASSLVTGSGDVSIERAKSGTVQRATGPRSGTGSSSRGYGTMPARADERRFDPPARDTRVASIPKDNRARTTHPVIYHRKPGNAVAGRPLLLELRLSPGLPGYKVVPSVREGGGSWSRVDALELTRRRFRVLLHPEQGPLVYRFQLYDPKGWLVSEASYRVEVREPRVRILGDELSRGDVDERRGSRVKSSSRPRQDEYLPSF